MYRSCTTSHIDYLDGLDDLDHILSEADDLDRDRDRSNALLPKNVV